MRQRIATAFGTCFVIGVAGVTIGCGGPGDDGVPVEKTADGAGETFEIRLVDREYPYTLPGFSDEICGDWEFVSASGVVVDVRREWYPMNTMNQHLRNVGTPEGVAHVDAGFRDALLAKGISRIETCDHARDYVRLGRERTKFYSPTELEPPPVPESEPIYEPDLGADTDAELVDKIIVGTAFDHPSTVAVQFPGGWCTGQLIGPFAILTAGHCIPVSSGFIEIRAWFQMPGGVQKCISHPGGGNCPALNGTLNAYAGRHPSYDGSYNHDLGVIIVNPGWFPPADSSTRWTRFAFDFVMPLWTIYAPSPIRIDGYGSGGPGEVGAVSRRGVTTYNSVNGFDPLFQTFYLPRPSAAASGTCVGDSGSGANNAALLNANVSLGVLSASPPPWDSNACTGVGGYMVYTIPDGQWVSNSVNYFGGSCSTLTHQPSAARYVKCW